MLRGQFNHGPAPARSGRLRNFAHFVVAASGVTFVCAVAAFADIMRAPTEDVMAIDQDKLNEFLGKFVADFGATFNAGMVVIGDKLGLYKALAVKPMNSAELAAATSTDERYVREWLSSQAAGGYVRYNPVTRAFSLTAEQAFTLADESSPAYLPGAFELALAALKAVPRITDAFKTGAGVGWHEHDPGLFSGTEKFFRPGYVANLTTAWIPALNGVEAKLKAGAKVADVGCGHGASTLIMGQAYPNSTFIGHDYHEPSIEHARKAAKAVGLNGGRVSFEPSTAMEFPGNDHDFVAVFDCLHDMGDPVGASRHVRQALKPDGTWMIVEPYANDRLEDNLNPVGRIFYSASTLICTPTSRAQIGSMCLGAQAGECNLREVVGKGGFTHFRRATETPFNLVFEARP
jgi:2-polyprenyl-3-methyl-5-hydroxy-6-metoxy-1,4-benzoquinol methylase